MLPLGYCHSVSMIQCASSSEDVQAIPVRSLESCYLCMLLSLHELMSALVRMCKKEEED